MPYLCIGYSVSSLIVKELVIDPVVSKMAPCHSDVNSKLRLLLKQDQFTDSMDFL